MTPLEEPGMVEDRFLKRLRKKARKGLRGWPIATIAFYGPNLHQATKTAVGIVPSENAEVEELRAWIVEVAKRSRGQPAPKELSVGTSPPSLGQEHLPTRSTSSAASTL